MSTASKITLGVCTCISVGIIGYVHWRQFYDREQLHLGVIRDFERQKQRKIQNLYVLTQQEELAKELRRDLAEKESKKNIPS